MIFEAKVKQRYFAQNYSVELILYNILLILDAVVKNFKHHVN